MYLASGPLRASLGRKETTLTHGAPCSLLSEGPDRRVLSDIAGPGVAYPLTPSRRPS